MVSSSFLGRKFLLHFILLSLAVLNRFWFVTDSLILHVYFRCCVTAMERVSAATVFVTLPQCIEGNIAMSVQWVFFTYVVCPWLNLYARLIYERGYSRWRHGAQKQFFRVKEKLGKFFLLKLGKLTGNVQNFEKVRSNCNRNTRDFDLTLTDGKTFQLTVISALFCLNEGDGGFRTLPHLTFLFIWAG